MTSSSAVSWRASSKTSRWKAVCLSSPVLEAISVNSWRTSWWSWRSASMALRFSPMSHAPFERSRLHLLLLGDTRVIGGQSPRGAQPLLGVRVYVRCGGHGHRCCRRVRRRRLLARASARSDSTRREGLASRRRYALARRRRGAGRGGIPRRAGRGGRRPRADLRPPGGGPPARPAPRRGAHGGDPPLLPRPHPARDR